MSDKLRYGIGILLLCACAGLLIAACVPLPVKESFSFSGSGRGSAVLSPIPHLSSGDVFNRGTAEELCKLPGIGSTIAGRILQEREANGLFIYAEDIISVNGIGEKKLEQIRPYLIPEENSENLRED